MSDFLHNIAPNFYFLQRRLMFKVGVLMGGMSIEREVSFNSGRTICDHLDAGLFQVIPLFLTAEGELYILPWSFLYRGKIADFYDRLSTQAQKIVWDDLPKLIDFVYIAVHGKYGEDGRLQGMLELLKVPYLGSKIFASALGMNKFLHNRHLQAHGIAVPKGLYLSSHDIANLDDRQLLTKLEQQSVRFPVIVKPNEEGSSFGVSVVKNPQDLRAAIMMASTISGTSSAVLVEEKIAGMEFTCIVITDHEKNQLMALPPTQVLLSGASYLIMNINICRVACTKKLLQIAARNY
jgi:D-alanine--D-alanine ligase